MTDYTERGAVPIDDAVVADPPTIDEVLAARANDDQQGEGEAPPDTELVELERAAWQALSASGDAAAAFYERVLARQVLMLLPGGLVIDDRARVIDSMSGPPWDSFELSDQRVLRITEDSAAVAYRGTARRGDTVYEALFASTYVREDGAWRLALHQQTPA